MLGEDIGEIRIAPLQGEDNILAVCLHIGDLLHGRLQGRLGVRPHVMAHRGDDVGRRQILAVVEGHALAQLDDPGLRAVGRLEGFRQVGADVPFGIDLGQKAPEGHVDRAHVAVENRARVEGVRGRSPADADAQISALLGGGRPGLAEHRLGGRRHNAGSQRELHEFPAVHPPAADLAPHGGKPVKIRLLPIAHCSLPASKIVSPRLGLLPISSPGLPGHLLLRSVPVAAFAMFPSPARRPILARWGVARKSRPQIKLSPGLPVIWLDCARNLTACAGARKEHCAASPVRPYPAADRNHLRVMRITSVDSFPLRGRGQQGAYGAPYGIVVRIATDSGVVGYGESDSMPGVVKAVIEAPFLHEMMAGRNG